MSDKEPTIIRTGNSPFFTAPRATAQDRNLSFAARGVLMYLLSKPDNWTVRVTDLQQGCGRDKVRGLLAELEVARYLKREQEHDKDGRFKRVIYRVYDTPQPEEPKTETPLTENPATANPPLHNTESTEERKDKEPVLSTFAPPDGSANATPEKPTTPQEKVVPKKNGNPLKATAVLVENTDPVFLAVGQAVFGVQDPTKIVEVGRKRLRPVYGQSQAVFASQFGKNDKPLVAALVREFAATFDKGMCPRDYTKFVEHFTGYLQRNATNIRARMNGISLEDAPTEDTPAPRLPTPPAAPISCPITGSIPDEIAQQWRAAAQQMALQCDSANYDAWLRPMALIEYRADSHTFVIAGHSPMARDILQGRLQRNIERWLFDATGRSPKLEFVLAADWKEKTA